ncbi:YopX family protein [uncultured Streptococcus sp.]|uniref:YopX family protein n=1 Tax=uncultured Streptococcus sp. TaxID=83427 RepID=UPI0025F1DCDB|nr:YopX family protein [uncultured Streptococcus sp.]
MIPRYRAWDRIRKTMYEADDVKYIDIEKNQIYVKTPSSEQLNCYSLRDVDAMHSTGFTDKDGKCIFRGDIVAAETGLFAGVISIDQDLGAYVIKLIGYKDFVHLRAVANTVEIVGNVWENPELLEVKQ